MWSKELQELSRAYLKYTGTHVKSLNGKFGILGIDSQRGYIPRTLVRNKEYVPESNTFCAQHTASALRRGC
jgi:hypothetical protein